MRIKQRGNRMQALLLLVAREVIEVFEKVHDDGLVVVDAVAQRVVLRVLFSPRFVHRGDDGARLGDGERVHVFEVAQLDLVAHFFFLLDARLGARDEARGSEDLDLLGARLLGLRVVLHGCVCDGRV